MSNGNHRAYQPILPSASRMLAKRWDDSSYSLHRKKLSAAKPTVDTKPPKTYMHLQLKLKKLQLEEERLATVERDNRILLEKMSHIMRTRGRVDNHNDYQHKSLNRNKRQQELLRITQENQAILKRITSKQPFYDHNTWDQEYDQAVQYHEQISRYPKKMDTTSSSVHSNKVTTRSRQRVSGLSKADVLRIIAPKATHLKALKMINDQTFLEELWNECDESGSGDCSLLDISKLAASRGWTFSKLTLLRAYKKTTHKDEDGDSHVERQEFSALLKNLFLFEHLWDAFNVLDTEEDRRISQSEFQSGLASLGVQLSPREAENEFRKADKDGKGKILFSELCEYLCQIIGIGVEHGGEVSKKTRSPQAKKRTMRVKTPTKKGSNKQDDAHLNKTQSSDSGTVNHGLDPVSSSNSKEMQSSSKDHEDASEDRISSEEPMSIDTSNSAELNEKEILTLLNTNKLDEVWGAIDANGTGAVPIADVNSWIASNYPLGQDASMMQLVHRVSIKNANETAVTKEALFPILHTAALLSKLMRTIKISNVDSARRLTFEDCQQAIHQLELSIPEDETQAQLAILDTNEDNTVAFDEFVVWLLQKKS